MEILKHIKLNDGREMVVIDYQLRDDNTIVEWEWDEYENCTICIYDAEVLNVYHLHISASLCLDEKGRQITDWNGHSEYSYSVQILNEQGDVVYSDDGIESVGSRYADYDEERLHREVRNDLNLEKILLKK